MTKNELIQLLASSPAVIQEREEIIAIRTVLACKRIESLSANSKLPLEIIDSLREILVGAKSIDDHTLRILNVLSSKLPKKPEQSTAELKTEAKIQTPQGKAQTYSPSSSNSDNKMITWKLLSASDPSESNANHCTAPPIANLLKAWLPHQDLYALRCVSRMFASAFTLSKDKQLLNIKNNNFKLSIMQGLPKQVSVHVVLRNFLVVNTKNSISCWDTVKEKMLWSIQPSQNNLEDNFKGVEYEEALTLVDDQLLVFTKMRQPQATRFWDPTKKLLAIHDVYTGKIIRKFDVSTHECGECGSWNYLGCIDNLFFIKSRESNCFDAIDIVSGRFLSLRTDLPLHAYRQKIIDNRLIHYVDNRLIISELMQINGESVLTPVVDVRLEFAIGKVHCEKGKICVSYFTNNPNAPDFTLFTDAGEKIRDFRTSQVYVEISQSTNYKPDYNRYKIIESFIVTDEFVYAAGEHGEIVRYNYLNNQPPKILRRAILEQNLQGEYYSTKSCNEFILFNNVIVFSDHNRNIEFISANTGEVLNTLKLTTPGMIGVINNKLIYTNESGIMKHDYYSDDQTPESERNNALDAINKIERDGCSIQ